MALDRFVSSLGENVEQNATSLISSTKDQFSTEELKSMVTRSITSGISNCQLDRENKAQESRTKPGSSLAFRIRQITKDIRGTLDCNKLQQEVQKHMDSMEDQISDVTSEIKRKLEEVLPVVKVPLNPFKLPKYVKKATIGRVMPDLEATLDFVKRAVELSTAVADLASAVSEVIPRLESCAVSTVDMIFENIQNQIDEEIYNLKSDIERSIAEAICNGLKDAKISQNDLQNVFQAIDAVSSVVNNVKSIKAGIDETLEYSVGKISNYSADLQDLTGLVAPFDTANTSAFVDSISGDAYTQYKSDVIDVFNSPEPVIVTIPVITGNAYVGETLSCSNGVWSANGVVTSNTFSYAFQWYRGGAEIYGANTSIYVPVVDDVQSSLFCIVTAETAVTIETAQTEDTAPVQFQLTGANQPTITGTPSVGQTLTCSSGSWPSDVFMYYYEWVRSDNTVVKARSTSNQYTVQLADQTMSISCKVFAQMTKYVLSTNSTSVGPIT